MGGRACLGVIRYLLILELWFSVLQWGFLWCLIDSLVCILLCSFVGLLSSHLNIDSHVDWLVRLLIHSATMCPFCLSLVAMNIRITLGIYAQAILYFSVLL